MIKTKEEHAKPKSMRPWEVVRTEILTKRGLAGRHWYAAHCVGAPDAKVRDVVKRISDWDIYIPQCLELRATPKRLLAPSQRNSGVPIMRSVEVALFPRYPFLRLDLCDPRCHEVFKLLGVQGLICDGESSVPQPAYIDDVAIDELMARERNGEIVAGVSLKQFMYEVGEQVRIRNGSFAGFNGSVETVPDVPVDKLDQSARLSIWVFLFGRQNLVELSIADIEKL
jgi:transcriptional antiterminator NusG